MRAATEYYLRGGRAAVASVPSRRGGLVRADGKAIRDDHGLFHPLGRTLFWALYGWKHERSRILADLDWSVPYGLDSDRILCEVDWPGRSIDPTWPDYEQILGDHMDASWARGRRVQLVLGGGQRGRELAMLIAEKVARVINAGRAHIVLFIEIWNEWSTDNKIDLPTLEKAARYMRTHTPCLVALSCPKPKRKKIHDDTAGEAAMIAATKRAGGTMFVLHNRRSDSEGGWDNVSQGYDFKNFPFPVSNNEDQGPQSSVKAQGEPLLLVMQRINGVACSGALYNVHAAQGVTGIANARYGRPDRMAEVPQIDAIFRAARSADALLPEGIENWRVRNNERDDHPLPIASNQFWEDRTPRPFGVHKNYAAVSPDGRFVVPLLGVKHHVTMRALHACDVEAVDPVSGETTPASLKAGQSWTLLGRADGQTGYVVSGRVI